MRLKLTMCVVGATFLAACGIGVRNPQVHFVEAPPHRDQPVKVHMRSGELVVLDNWGVSEVDSMLFGSGQLYGIDRRHRRTDTFSIPFDSIALLETSSREVVRPAGLSVLAVWTTLTGAVTAICVANPKSCFGSCPTFYVDDADGTIPQAEGFSSSIARVLEARDVDALYHARATGPRFSVRMTNEALETHAVRRVRLLAAPRPAGGRVFATAQGRYFPAFEILRPNHCAGPGGDCLALVHEMDGLERTSLTDSADLAARETIELEFPATIGSLGLVIGARHTFVSTFLFYQTMAYMGRSAGEWLAALERGDEQLISQAMGMERVLGGIEVSVAESAGPWRAIGTYGEAGPIATDVSVLPFLAADGHSTGPLRVRLRMAKGNWRVNYVALARLGSPVTPTVLEPDMVTRAARPDTTALSRLRDPNRYLITYPGDEYQLVFMLPEAAAELELFLESQGYYYEWMRSEWLDEEDPAMVSLILFRPEAALRLLAPRFKRVEPQMERLFWASRFGGNQ